MRIASRLGLPPEQVSMLGEAAPLHDIGKIGTPDRILLKPGQLTDLEREEMRRHAILGWQLLSASSSPVLELGATIALNHHEWWDGSGYPQRLAGEAIPIATRIVAVADVFDALTHARPTRLRCLSSGPDPRSSPSRAGSSKLSSQGCFST